MIVVSILLAFGIDAWWGNAAQRQAERELLASIVESVEVSEAGLNRALNRLNVDEARTARFYNLPANELASFPRDSVQNLYTAMFRANTFDVLQGPLSGVLTTAQLSLIQDDGVRAALNQWLAIANNLGDWNQRLTGLAEGGLVALGHHEVFRDAWLNGVQALPPAVDLKAVRDDDEVMALAAAVVRSRGIQRRYSGETLTVQGEC